MRLPSTLLHGRVRTSTVGLVLLLVALLALYFSVRPVPAGLVRSDGATGSGSSSSARSSRPAEERPGTPAPDGQPPRPPAGSP